MHPCSKCGFENPDTMKFCGNCGNALASRCPRCGFENPAPFRFCGQCGAPLRHQEPAELRPSGGSPPAATPNLPEQAAAAPNEERKTVTALFADIKGSMELMEELDP